jgi:hypothetical protein
MRSQSSLFRLGYVGLGFVRLGYVGYVRLGYVWVRLV